MSHERCQEMRRNDLKHQEARDRALRETRRRIAAVQGHIDDHNFGLAQNGLNTLLQDLDDKFNTPAIVRYHLEVLL